MRHVIVGTGRWGTQLARRLHELGQGPAALVNRKVDRGLKLAAELEVPLFPLAELPEALSKDAWVWLCVADDALVEVQQRIPAKLCNLCIQASGSAPLAIMPYQTGVVWPLQSISFAEAPDWSSMVLVVEGCNDSAQAELMHLSTSLSGRPSVLLTNPAQRVALHAAAVITQNFGNHLWTLSTDLLAQHGLDASLLLPLHHAHLKALSTGVHPSKLQSGPAVREDLETINRHRSLLTKSPRLLKLYTDLSRAIMEYHNESDV